MIIQYSFEYFWILNLLRKVYGVVFLLNLTLISSDIHF